MKKDLTTAELAALDQESAALEEHLDLVITVYKGLRSESGELSAACGLTAWLPTRFDQASVAALLATALGRLHPSVA